MGNTGSALCERVKGLTESELSKSSREDDEVALIVDELYQPNYLSTLKDLSNYEIPVLKPRQAPSADTKLEEVKFAFVHCQENRVFDKHEDLRSALQSEIFSLLSKEDDPDFKDICTKLQSLCRVQEGLIRQEERERRRLMKSSQSSEEKQKKKKKELPVPAQIGLQFGVETLINLVRVVGTTNHEIFGLVMNSITGILIQLTPLSLNIDDGGILKGLDTVKTFLESVLKGSTLGATETDSVLALAPLFGMALSKGDLSSALAVAQKFLELDQSPAFSNACSMMMPLLKNLSDLEGSGIGRKTLMNWNPNKLGPDIALSNENLSVTRTDSSGWGCQLSEQSLTSGIHYYEYKIDRNNSSCLLLGVAGAQFNNFTSKSSGAHCYTLQADGDAYMNDRGSGNVFRFGEGDRIGILINMEDKNITFFLNGKKQNKPPFGPLPDEVYLLACFGGSNQFVTVLNEPEIPDEAQDAIGSHLVPHKEEEKKDNEEEDEKQGEEVQIFPIRPREILKSSRFRIIAEGRADVTKLTAQELSVFLLACLDKLNEAYFEVFKLNEKPSSEPIKAKLSKQQPLCLEIKPEVFHMLTSMLKLILQLLKEQVWKKMDFHLCAWAGVCLLRLIRSHLFTVLFLQLKDEETGITHELREILYGLLQDFLELEVTNFGGEYQTKEDLDALNALKKESSLTLIHGFEVFYPTQVAKLDYINKSLEDTKAKKKLHDIHLNIQKLVFDKMSIPVNLSAAFSLEVPETAEKVEKLLELLLDICGEQSHLSLAGNPSQDSSYYLKFLHSAQKVLLSKAARDDFKGQWQVLLIKYTQKLFNTTQQLVDRLKVMEPNAEERGRKTILESLVTNLLLALCLSQTTTESLSLLIQPLMNIINTMNSIGVKDPSQARKKTAVQSQSYESNHPCTNVSETKLIKVPNAIKYSLKFDNQCNIRAETNTLELFTDENKTNLIGKWDGNNFPRQTFIVEGPSLFFNFTSNEATDLYGWKIDIEVEAETDQVFIPWTHHLRVAANFLIVLFSKKLILGDENDDELEVLKNPLFKYGIQDKCQKMVLPSLKPKLDENLVNLVIIPGADSGSLSFRKGSMNDRKSSLPGFKPAEPNQALTLAGYIANYTASAASLAQYSENLILEEWIAGSDRVNEAWSIMKKEAGAVGPHTLVGGVQMDQAERALFAVYSSFFDFVDVLGSLIESPKEVSDTTLKGLIRQACQIRKWAQQQKQELMDNNAEVDYSSIVKDIIKRCVILIHCEFKQALNELGIHRITVNTFPSYARAQTTDTIISGSKGPEAKFREGNKWKSVKQAAESVNRLRTLLKIVGPGRSNSADQDDEKKEFNKVNTLIFEFLEDKTELAKYFSEVDKKRNQAMARTIGINYLMHMFKISSRSHKALKGQIVRIFSEAFRVNGSSKKKHYLKDLEGVDSQLQKCVQRSFFLMYQLLLNHLRISEVKELDCTGQEASHMYLKTFEALSFPFEDIDSYKLLDLKLHESLSFLLTWSKGQKINEYVSYKFDPTNCITSLKVHNEEEFQENQPENAECFSLSTVNRLEGEFGQESEVTQKLCLEIIRGEANKKPIVQIYIGAMCEEDGFELIEGNINEQGENLFLFVKRSEPKENISILSKLEVIEDNPIVLRPIFIPYSRFLVKEQDATETAKRNERKQFLRQAAWILFKHLVYTCAGKPEHKYMQETLSEVKKFKLQTMFAELLLGEASWVRTKERVDMAPRDVAKLRLKRVSSGELWMQGEVSKAKPHRNPMIEWVTQFRETFKHLYPSDISELAGVESPIAFVENWFLKIDPAMKGILTIEELKTADIAEELREEQRLKNNLGQIDFFCYLNFIIKENYEVAQEYGDDEYDEIYKHKLMNTIPKDFYAAMEEVSFEVPNLIAHLKREISPVSQNSILNYLELFETSSDPEKPGIVHPDKILPNTPSEFINPSKDLDFFLMLNAIYNFPNKFGDYYSELHQALPNTDDLPASVEEMLNPQKVDSSLNDYIASLLWVLYQTCCSDGMTKVLAKPEYIEGILRHMLFGASETIIVIAFRIIRSIVPSQLTPQLFSQIWQSIPKEFMDKYLSPEIRDDWLSTFLAFVGMRNSYHIKSDKEFIPNLSKLGIWSNEASEFLKAVCMRNKWKQEVLTAISNSIESMLTNLEQSNFVFSYDLGLGSLSFLTMCSSNYSPLDKHLQEWSYVTLKGGSLPQGHVISLNKKTRVMQVYSEEDDAIHDESMNHLDQMVSLIRPNLFSSMSSAESQHLFKMLNKLIVFIKEKDKVPIVDDVEKLHSIRAIWRQLECLVYQTLSSLTSHKVQYTEEEANQMVESVFSRVISNEDGDVVENSLRYRTIRMLLYSKLKQGKIENLKKNDTVEIEISEEKEEEEFKYMSEEEEMKIIAAMNEEQQIIVVSLKSMGFNFRAIQAAMNAKLKDVEEIAAWITEKKEQEEHKQAEPVQVQGVSYIYKLRKEESITCQITDHSGIAHFDESASGHMSITCRIPLDEKKAITKHFEANVFRHLNEFCPEITFLATIGFKTENISGIIGLSIGSLQISIDSTQEIALVMIGTEIVGTISKSSNYSFRIFANFNGSMTIQNETEEFKHTCTDLTVYDGLAIGDFGIFLVLGESVMLKGFAICQGHFTGTLNYWEDEKAKETQKPAEEKNAKRFVDLKPKEQNQTALRLRTTGAPLELCEELASRHVSFDKALEVLLDQNTSFTWEDQLETNIDPPIVEIAMVDSVEDIEEGYLRVGIYMDGQDITDTLILDNRKILCYKQHYGSAPPGNMITSISIGGTPESHKEDTEIGNLTKNQEGDIENRVWATKLARAKLGTRQPLTKIMMLASKNPNQVTVPPGFEVVHYENKAVNIAQDSCELFVFIAYCKTSALLGYPVTPLIYSKVNLSEHGLVDVLDNVSPEANAEKMKKIEEELANYNQYSLIELLAHIKHLDEVGRNLAMKTFFLQIIQILPSTLPYLVCKNPENFALLYNLLKDNISILESTILKVLQGPYAVSMARILLHECILQLILASTCSAPTGKLSELIIESGHPYENNMRHDQTITIPGAAGLRIEFDQQCHTESGCDILRFFRQQNHVGQICEYSGRSFPDFEVEGDTILLYFYSDSSCVEWGYKFRVIPVEPANSNSNDPLLKRMSIEHALWILEKLILGQKTVPIECHRFLQKELINPLTIFIHSIKDPNKQERGVRILQGLLKKQSESFPALQRVVDLITEETRSLYHFEKSNKGSSELLQKLVSLITELKAKFHINLDERWFHEICDAFAIMKGFCNRDENMYPILFEQFRATNKVSLERSRESIHPYSKKPTTKEVSVKGASFLEIEFDERSKLDNQDAILFTYDKAGLQPIETGTDVALTDAAWANDPRGPDIQFSNNNRAVTRTNSSGWGCAVWSESYSQGKIKITFHIDNDGRSDYLYIGIFKADGNYRLNEVINSDNSHDLWTWKTTGEFHRRGEKVTNSESKYRSGDSIALMINMEERTITFIKNEIELHTFNDIADEVIPVVCFGGSNQNLTVSSVESYIASFSKLSKKKFTIDGDQVFYHFPINCGYLLTHMHAWKRPSNLSGNIYFSQDQRKVKTTGAVENRSVQITGLGMQAGRHYIEILVNKMKENDKIQLGIVPDGIERHGSLVRDNTACYQANGIATFNGVERQIEPFQAKDIIGIYFDIEKSTTTFYKNMVEVATSVMTIDAERSYVFAVSFDGEKQEVIINKTPAIPEEIDLMGMKREFPPGAEAKEWGYKFKVTPCYTGDNKMRVIECLTEKQLEKWKIFTEKHLSNISKATEEQLVQFIDELCTSKGKDPSKLEIEDINPAPQDLRHYQLLENLSVSDLQDMFRIISYFNKQVEKILPLISLDLNTTSREGLDELQKLFLSTRGYIFFNMKNSMFNAVLNSTKTESRPEISVDRTKAMRLKYLGKVDSQALVSLFGQIYRVINSNTPRSFRNPERIFKVVFRGEGSTDAGGPYNEALSTMCDELMSRFLPLFVPTQNKVHNVGENRDSWIINPIADSALQLDLFQFLGKLMGVAIRTQNNLNLTLPPLFWKRLMLEEVTINDLKGVDECCVQMLDILRNLNEQGINPDNFGDAFENINFSTHDSSGRIVDLVKDGREIPVTYQRAQEYAILVEQLRLNESEKQYTAIRKGISCVVPLNLLNLFSWKQVENMVCGAADIDVDLLKGKTEYENISADAPHVKYFWEVLKEVSARDRSQFLRFVWGRSRLPSGRDFKRFKLTQLNKAGNPDSYLPVAHTCFFQLDLPPYSSKEIMREKFLYAITHCQAIDLDRVAEGGWEEEINF